MNLLPTPTPTGKKKAFAFRGYQREDMARAAMHDGVVCSLDPGLGKTIVAFTWPQMKDAKRILIVAPEGLHEQICDEGRDKFGIPVRPLRNHEDFAADKLLQQAALEHRNGEEPSVTGWWITSYSALGFNGGDMWLPKEKDDGTEIVNTTIVDRRRKHPLYVEANDVNIGKVHDNGVRCIFYPNLALLVSALFDCVVCDEAVRLKSDASYTSLGVRHLTPPLRLVLTATPIKNRLDDIFWLAQWACGGNDEPSARWPYPNTNKARGQFADEHMLIERNHTREARHVAKTGKFKSFTKRTPQICNIHRLWKLLGPVVMRRRKDDTGEDIVPKTIIPIRVKPGTAQQLVYQHHLQNRPQIAKNGNPMAPIAAAVAQLQNLRQAALCPDSPNLSLTSLSMFGLRAIIEEAQREAKKAASNPNADPKLTNKATLVARKGVATPFENEAEAAFQIIERMAEGGKIDLAKVIEAAPSLADRLKPFIIQTREAKPPTARSWTDHNPKQAAILKLISDLIGVGEQVVVMSPFQDFSLALYRRLIEAGVSVCLLDGTKSPKKRGALAKQFKRRRFAVLVGGIQSMGEGHSFECCSNLILPSIEWAFDNNKQAVDRVHRLNSLKPVTIYTMVTSNTIDERLESVFREKGDSSALALDGRLFADKTDEINLGDLLRDAIRNFNPAADTIDEKAIEQEWDDTLKARLRHAERQFREWHPPIVSDGEGEKVTAKEIRAAIAGVGITPVVTLVRAIPAATFGALIGSTKVDRIEQVRESFTAYCAAHPEVRDWRRAWSAFEQGGGLKKRPAAAATPVVTTDPWPACEGEDAADPVGEAASFPSLSDQPPKKDKPTPKDAADWIDGL